jgi:hypothetical protein
MARLPKQRKKKTDIQITNSGSGFYGIYGESARGSRWCKRNVQGFSTLMYARGVAYCDDHRMVTDILAGALDAGLTVETPNGIWDRANRPAEVQGNG